MLNALFIQNLAVIEKAYIEFDSGLNVFTGETGAGKSIVIDAIGAILGKRVSKDIVRTGTQKAVISAVFGDLDDEQICKIKEMGADIEDGELIIIREISADGRSSARVCGFPVTAASLKDLGDTLINIHGQHDTKLLFSTDSHLDLIDTFGDIMPLRAEYSHIYKTLRKIETELADIANEQSQKSQRIDELSLQMEEISDAALFEGEDTELETESKAIHNAARITESLSSADMELNGNDDFEGAVDKINSATSSLDHAAGYYSDLADLASKAEEISYQVVDLAAQVSSFLSETNFSPGRQEEIETRLDEIYRLKRKYGDSIADILQHYEDCRKELEKIEMYDVRTVELITHKQKYILKESETRELLTNERRISAEQFAGRIKNELEFLDMPAVKLIAELSPCEPSANGAEKAELLISANIGELPKPLAKTASGGELSRIMLAIKNVLADKDEIPTMIFDEVDSGVSGKAAQKIGLKLKQAAQNRQIICVTHLAQIAALGDTHFLIEKTFGSAQTSTAVNKLDFEGRKHEVARIMSTGTITELMLQNAEEMLTAANK
ncbi:MAG: DNA repair protein RecN [Oscillospiraceae bacterium]|nr:DNA repair protein RecN [Oscillospiraceae bacterium]